MLPYIAVAGRKKKKKKEWNTRRGKKRENTE